MHDGAVVLTDGSIGIPLQGGLAFIECAVDQVRLDSALMKRVPDLSGGIVGDL